MFDRDLSGTIDLQERPRTYRIYSADEVNPSESHDLS